MGLIKRIPGSLRRCWSFKKILFLQLLFLTIRTNGQDLSALNLLANSNCRSSSCFENVISKKGFGLLRKERHSGNEEIIWYFHKNDVKFTIDSNNHITSLNSLVVVFVSGSSAIRVITTSERYYEDLLKQFHILGFEKNSNSLENKNKYLSSLYPNLIVWGNKYSPGDKNKLINFNILLQRISD